MSIATFESPRVSTQQFFAWVSENEVDTTARETARHTSSQPLRYEKIATPVAVPQHVATQHSATQDARDSQRIGKPVRLGAVMIKLLKSYGISDEEIAEGLAAYAANSELTGAGLAKAG